MLIVIVEVYPFVLKYSPLVSRFQHVWVLQTLLELAVFSSNVGLVVDQAEGEFVSDADRVASPQDHQTGRFLAFPLDVLPLAILLND